jgi:pathogenesis-related protein 1
MMKQVAFTARSVLAILALAGAAVAQVGPRGPQVSGAIPATRSAPSGAPVSSAPALAAEPASMAGMLAAQNGARSRVGLPALSWSPDLATKAEAIAKTVSSGKCSSDSAAIAAAIEDVAVHWVAGLIQLGGTTSAQTIRPSFVVSEWSAGQPDFDLARSQCRRSGACDHYARMVSAGARSVGCARALCPSRAQVWVCRYDNSARSSDPRRPGSD